MEANAPPDVKRNECVGPGIFPEPPRFASKKLMRERKKTADKAVRPRNGSLSTETPAPGQAQIENIYHFFLTLGFSRDFASKTGGKMGRLVIFLPDYTVITCIKD